jgi:hypothetical protein
MMRNLWCACLALLCLAGVARADSAQPDYPALVIGYEVAPANRQAFRHEVEAAGVRQFQHWKDDGILKEFRLLFSRHADAGNWDAMALLTFASASEAARWKAVERDAPAGLTPKALSLVSAIRSTPVELARAKSGAAGSGSVFVAIPYALSVPGGEYLKYADGYVLPQFDGWIGEKALAGYQIYLATLPAARPWAALAILQYRDDQALARREEVTARVRGRLKENPEWRAIAENKKNVRDEKQAVIADPLGASRD